MTRAKRAAALVVLAGLTLAGCGSSTGLTTAGGTARSCKHGTMTMPNGQRMCDSSMGGGSGTSTTGPRTSAGSKAMAGMNVGGSGTAVPEVNGIKPVPVQTLATSYWQGMEIQAQTRTPVRFILFNGAKERMVNPPKGASFHLMIMLTDRHTGEPIPYASSVWATITNSAGKTVYNDEQWAMISAYMGPHYGNNVPYLASGSYKLKVLISPPDVARTREYKDTWLKPHDVSMSFRWDAKTGSATVTGRGQGSRSSGSMNNMAGMSNSAHSNVSVNGMKVTPSRAIATAYWQGMKIQTRTAAPTPVYMPDGGSATKNILAGGSSLYMMVMLSDRYTKAAVTYAPVYATVKNAAGKAVFHGTLQPTISAFDGPFYGHDLKLPGRGRYTLVLRIDPPHQARHIEYQHVWLKPHTVVEHFSWDGKQ